MVEMFEFDLACGYAAIPKGLGKRYKKLRTKDISNEEITTFLTSLHPGNRLIGYLLYDTEEHQISQKLVDAAGSSEHPFEHCSSHSSNILFVKTFADYKAYIFR